MIDIHNFARWNGGIIGQGGPTDDQFVGLWTQLASKYAANSKVVFELMNEPHDLDINIWAQTCQKVVNAIREAGATSQMILLPGTNFDSAATLVSSGSAESLLGIINPDGTTDGLLLDVHKYLDVDNSGTHSECVSDNTAAFATVADFLRQKGRQAIVSETGASSAKSCMTAFCSQNAFINANSDVFIGLVAWAAGSFSSSYLLSLTPSKQGSGLVDNALAAQCVVRTWLDATDVPAPPPSPVTTVASSASPTGRGSMSTGQTAASKTESSIADSSTTRAATSKGPTTLVGASGSAVTTSATGDAASEGTSFPGIISSVGIPGATTSQSVSGNVALTLSIPLRAIFLCVVTLALQCVYQL